MATAQRLEALHLYKVMMLITSIAASQAMVQDENLNFVYNGFREANLSVDGDGPVYVLRNGLLQLTSSSSLGFNKGYAFYSSPIKFNLSSSQSLSFSTTFVFAMVPQEGLLPGHGLSFVISPSTDFSQAASAQHLGLFNSTNDGNPDNHIFAVELDTFKNQEFNDIDDNHVGIDVNSLASIDSAPATYFSESERKNKSLQLNGGDSIQVWIDYRGAEKVLDVTLAPITSSQKPSRPLLSTHLDLSQILLDTMYVGFAASTGQLIVNQYILGWSFSRIGPAQNLDISKLPSLPSTTGPAKTSELAKIIIIVSVLALVIVLITIGGAVYYIKNKQYEEIYEEWEKQYDPQRFSYKTLYKATKGFRDRELIGKGGFGSVYKGILPSSNLEIAVKRVSHNSEQRMKEFVA